MKIEITDIIIIYTSGTDCVILNTKLPAATWPFEGNATLKLETAKHTGETYCQKNFPGIPFKIIEN